MKVTHHTGLRRAHAGFTLLELIVVIAIMAIVVGAAVPVTGKVLTYKAKKATRDELQTLSDASSDFFRDTGRLPASVGELLTTTGDAGWSGPYLAGVVTDAVTGHSGYEVDAWSRPYSFQVVGDQLTIRSSGEDDQYGDSGDPNIALNVTPIRREQTLDELKLINQAIVLYNGQFQITDPLDTQWSQAVDQLVGRGLLPSGGDYLTDAWGRAYEPDPPAVSPVVKVRSPSVVAVHPGSGDDAGSDLDD